MITGTIKALDHGSRNATTSARLDILKILKNDCPLPVPAYKYPILFVLSVLDHFLVATIGSSSCYP